MAKPNSKKSILIYVDCGLAQAAIKLGVLSAYPTSGSEVFEFEYTQEALIHPQLQAFRLDPDLPLQSGKHYCPNGRSNFGMFLDSSPDRWGRKLMQRRLERDQRTGRELKSKRLIESDYLLGVHDSYRVGALRFKSAEEGPWLDDNDGQAAPPLVKLRSLEQASLALDSDIDNDVQIDEWLRLLIAPGGSLGGARPKASVIAPDGQLMIAKFPKSDDKINVGAWEMVLHTLANACGIDVPEAQLDRFSSPHHTFLINRFDREKNGARHHFASAMTLTGHIDGASAVEGASYLEIAEVLIAQGADTNADLIQLWTRIVFNMLVSNTDDHLRNHGFLLVPGRGWKLSPAYDMNPVANATGLTLNVSTHDNAKDISLALSIAPLFRIRSDHAQDIVVRLKKITSQWRKIADGVAIPRKEQDAMENAFALAA